MKLPVPTALTVLLAAVLLVSCSESDFPCDQSECRQWAAYDLDGNCQCLDQWIGQQPTVVLFWDMAGFPPCEQALLALDSLYPEFSRRGVEFLFIHLDQLDSGLDYAGYIRDKELRGVHLSGTYNLQRLLQTTRPVVPAALYLDRDGNVTNRQVGFAADGTATCRELLEQIAAAR